MRRLGLVLLWGALAAPKCGYEEDPKRPTYSCTCTRTCGGVTEPYMTMFTVHYSSDALPTAQRACTYSCTGATCSGCACEFVGRYVTGNSEDGELVDDVIDRALECVDGEL